MSQEQINDKSKVAIVCDEKMLTEIITALSIVLRTHLKHPGRIAYVTKLLEDLGTISQAAFS